MANETVIVYGGPFPDPSTPAPTAPTWPTIVPAPAQGVLSWPLAAPQGWECPRCACVYAPHVTECWRCNSALRLRVTTGVEVAGTDVATYGGTPDQEAQP